MKLLLLGLCLGAAVAAGAVAVENQIQDTERSEEATGVAGAAWLRRLMEADELALTRDLSIVRMRREGDQEERRPEDEKAEGALKLAMQVDEFVRSHGVRMRTPQELVELLPTALSNALPKEVTLPLTPPQEQQGRGLLKRAALPFLLGLKLQAAVAAPLALALVALATWKATTLALLSLVLSGAVLLLKMAGPKTSNVEVVHLPAAAPVAAGPWEPHGRSLEALEVLEGVGAFPDNALPQVDAQSLAYAAQRPLNA